jgi:L-ascorbate metabolism protein UlaG (beta-lactamase superfamily)
MRHSHLASIRVLLAAAALSAAVPASVSVSAQSSLPKPDILAATGGDISIQPLNHATLQLTWNNHVILVDPTGQANYTGLAAPDIILVTDIHGDHLDPATIAKVRKASTKIVAPSAAASKLESPIVIANGETKTVDTISIEAIPMYNMIPDPEFKQIFHTKGRGNGYVVTLGGKRIYIAGDTEGIPEMRALKNIDVAFVPMNLPYTMTETEAAEAVKAFAPKVVYPYHYRGSDPAKFAAAVGTGKIEVRLRDWYAK